MNKSTKKAIKKHLDNASKTVAKAGEKIRPGKSSSSTPRKTVAAAAGLAALGAAGVATARALKQRKANGSTDEPSTTFRVEADGEEGWILTSDGKQDDQRFGSKREALRVARRQAAEAQPSRLIIHRTDGRVQRSHTY